MMASLAGGTGSGTGSALLEALADEYPASTIAAAAVAPGHTGAFYFLHSNQFPRDNFGFMLDLAAPMVHVKTAAVIYIVRSPVH